MEFQKEIFWNSQNEIIFNNNEKEFQIKSGLGYYGINFPILFEFLVEILFEFNKEFILNS